MHAEVSSVGEREHVLDHNSALECCMRSTFDKVEATAKVAENLMANVEYCRLQKISVNVKIVTDLEAYVQMYRTLADDLCEAATNAKAILGATFQERREALVGVLKLEAAKELCELSILSVSSNNAKLGNEITVAEVAITDDEPNSCKPDSSHSVEDDDSLAFSNAAERIAAETLCALLLVSASSVISKELVTESNAPAEDARIDETADAKLAAGRVGIGSDCETTSPGSLRAPDVSSDLAIAWLLQNDGISKQEASLSKPGDASCHASASSITSGKTKAVAKQKKGVAVPVEDEAPLASSVTRKELGSENEIPKAGGAVFISSSNHNDRDAASAVSSNSRGSELVSNLIRIYSFTIMTLCEDLPSICILFVYII